ncbi:MAG: hypothetical protein RR472_07430, partial [Anaerovoracaceae bacterium]
MLEREMTVNTKAEKAMIVILMAAILLGGYPIGGFYFVVYGIGITLYRVLIPIIFLYFFGKRIMKGISLEFYGRFYFLFMGFLIFWCAWGTVFWKISDFSEYLVGANDIVGIFMGMLSIFSLYEAAKTKYGFKIMVNTVRILVVAITLIGVVELGIGEHLSTSKFCDGEYVDPIRKAVEGTYPGRLRFYYATGIFYNVNDLCAFLAVFSPLFFPQQGQKRSIKLLFLLELVMMILIISKDDAWFSVMGIIAAGITYLLVTKAKLFTWIGTVASFMVIKYFIVKVFYYIVYGIYLLIPGKEVPYAISLTVGEKISDESFQAVLRAQLASAKLEQGSFYTRWSTYVESVKDFFLDSYGVGFGPASFSNYMLEKNSSALLLNPHCFWIEVMFQYGLIVFVGFVALLLYGFIRLVKKYRETGRVEYALIMAMDMGLVF